MIRAEVPLFSFVYECYVEVGAYPENGESIPHSGEQFRRVDRRQRQTVELASDDGRYEGTKQDLYE